MRREPLFTTAGFYGFVLRSNALLHREAADWAAAALQARFTRSSDIALRVLDLACGGLPTTVAAAMAALPQRRFRYTGIDVNPDQVRRAREQFAFPDHVAAELIEGNAWDLDEAGIAGPFDVVFSGMNLHHGSPEEIRLLARQLAARLADGGVFLSHDVYRPDDQPHRRRPQQDPAAPAEPYRLIDAARLAAAGIVPEPIVCDASPGEPAWRLDYLEGMRRALASQGGDPQGIEETLAHMRARDFPVSTALFQRICASEGLAATVTRHQGPHPLAAYIAFCSAERGRS